MFRPRLFLRQVQSRPSMIAQAGRPVARKRNLMYTGSMSLSNIVNNFKRNYATVEIGIFMWLYSWIIELTDNSPFVVFDYHHLFSNDFLIRNTAPIFWFAGLSAFIAAGSSFFSFKLFMSTLTLATLAGIVRLEALFFHGTKPQPILFALVWLHVIFMQMLVLVKGSGNSKERELRALRGESDGI